jgi:hypothetical protein
MGWNDHDDRVQEYADTIEMGGVPYNHAYAIALDIVEDQIRDGEWTEYVPDSYLCEMIDEYTENGPESFDCLERVNA